MLFIILVGGRGTRSAKRGGGFKWIHISNVLFISHLLFVDDILIFCDGSHRHIDKICEGMDLLQVAT